MRRAFIFDPNKCFSCNACTIACKDWNQVNPGPVRWRTATVYETEAWPDMPNLFVPFSMSCNHCAKPACASGCSANAIIKRPGDGVVYADRNKCKGLKACISACPFEKPRIADDDQEPDRIKGWQVRHPVQKCDFCMERIDGGKQPVCVEACPTFALEMGDYDELLAKYRAAGKDVVQLNPMDFPYAYKKGGRTDTDPSLLIVRRTPMKFTEDIDTSVR